MEMGKAAGSKLSGCGFQDSRPAHPFVELVSADYGGALGRTSFAAAKAHYSTGYIERPAWTNTITVGEALREKGYRPARFPGDVIVGRTSP